MLGAKPLFSNLTIRELMEPSAHAPRSALERHHLFPRAYLQKLGYDRLMCDQIANLAFIEWQDNAAMGSAPPAEYFPPLFSKLSPREQEAARFWHALPPDWENMDYEEFLKQRRKLIAKVVKAAFEKIVTGQVPAEYEEAPLVLPGQSLPRWTVRDLIEGRESKTVEFKSSAFYSYKPDVLERVVSESVIKTVAAFLNTDGGHLAIGVSDDLEILGIRPDLDLKDMDVDRYINALTNMLISALGAAAVANVRIKVEELKGEPVCIVRVLPSPEPVYAKPSKGDQVFYVRMNNTTRILEGKDLVSYVTQRWG